MTNNKLNPGEWGTVARVADMLGIEPQTLRKAIARDEDRNEGRFELRALFGGTVLISVASVKRYLKNPPKRGPKKGR